MPPFTVQETREGPFWHIYYTYIASVTIDSLQFSKIIPTGSQGFFLSL